MKLTLRNISKNYGQKRALDGVSFSLTPGVYGLLGPNGAGKSTLMNILTGNLDATEGEILIDDRLVREMDRAYFEKIGYMPQQQALYPAFQVEQFLLYIAALKGLENAAARRQIAELLQRVELSDVGRQKISTLSGGMKQRLLLVQAALGNPQLLILDEPTAGLDPKQRIAIRNLIAELALDKIVLIATHIVSDVEFIAREFLLLKEGKLLKKDTRENLIETLPTHVYELQVPEEMLGEISARFRIGNIARERGELLVRVITEETVCDYGAKELRPTMEDVYLSYFEDEAENHSGMLVI